ncbi:MAG: methyltransferase domain-containing protein [Nitrospira sp.]|nr:methyltransferase domain-containing protein [Nitrospira sp.]
MERPSFKHPPLIGQRFNSPAPEETNPLEDYLSGRKLYGDDFTLEQIDTWFKDEKEGYAELGAKNRETYRYPYHALNSLHGFRYLTKSHFSHALGLGAAYGDEFEPLASKIEKISIVEPSNAFASNAVCGIPATYVPPDPSGVLPFAARTFDLVTCLGVLHHIPNVTFIVSEISRCMRKGGYALIHEPVVSMGDWTRMRPGLTKHERGIPLRLFREILKQNKLRIENEALCVFPGVQRVGAVGASVYNNRAWTAIDGMLCRLFGSNLSYHTESIWKKLRPTSAYFVVTRE